ncbi:unnamed protein product [Dicrocoelium dendriticum]|nr:unnamed protein product [Dicrocoelium dendriticum]
MHIFGTAIRNLALLHFRRASKRHRCCLRSFTGINLFPFTEWKTPYYKPKRARCFQLHIQTPSRGPYSDRVDREAICPRPQSISDSTHNYGPVDFQIETDSMALTRVFSSEDIEKYLHSDCAVHIRVATLNDGVQSIHQITVYVQDINDNAPGWPMRSTVVYFRDGDPAGAKQQIPLASDLDVGVNAIIVYQLKVFNSGLTISSPTGSSQITVTDIFELNKEPSTSGHVGGKLFLVAKHDIDREASPNGWDLILLASNIGPNRALSSQLHIHINVTDVNDNTPRFTQEVYQPQLPNQKAGIVPETMPVGQVVVRVQATDPDEGLNGLVSYDFVPSPEVTTIKHFFELTQTGELRTRNRLQVDKLLHQGETLANQISLPTGLMTIEIQAVDGSEPAYARTGYATVKLRVEDVDDEAPVIRIHPVRPWTDPVKQDSVPNTAVELAVSENEIVGQLLGLIEVSDPDNGEHETLRCNLVSTTAHLFRLSQQDTSGHEFRLYTASKLDREKTERLLVTIECRDLVDHVSSVNVGVNVIDVNDHDPQFKETLYQFSIFEDDGEQVSTVAEPQNRSWLTSTGRAFVEATDPDYGENRRIVYKLKDTSDAMRRLFSINRDTGELYALGPFDREQAPEHQIVVLAMDNGEPTLTGTCVVEVTVLDVNDNPPMFSPEISSSGGYTFTVLENQLPGTKVGRIEAYDVDQLPAPFSGLDLLHGNHDNRSYLNQPIERIFKEYLRYGLQSEPDSKAFWIDPKSGTLITRLMLDREKQSVYTFHVTVRDGISETGSRIANKNPQERLNYGASILAGRVHEVSVLVTVTVGDENDNDPVFIRPNSTNHMVILDPTAIPGQSLHQLYATDPDEGPNGLIKYAIKGGNSGALFNVDPRTGLLYLENQIPRNAVNVPNPLTIESSLKTRGHGDTSNTDFPPNPTYLLALEACDHGQPPRCSTFPNLQIQTRTPSSRTMDMSHDASFLLDGATVGKQMLKGAELMSQGVQKRERQSEYLSAAEIIIITLSIFFSVIVIGTVISVCIVRRGQGFRDYEQKTRKSANVTATPNSTNMELINHHLKSPHGLYSSKLSPVLQPDGCGGQWTFANHTEESEAGTLPRAGIDLLKSGGHQVMDTRFQCVPDIVRQPQFVEQHYGMRHSNCDYGLANYNYPPGVGNMRNDYQSLDNWTVLDSVKLAGSGVIKPEIMTYPLTSKPSDDSPQVKDHNQMARDARKTNWITTNVESIDTEFSTCEQPSAGDVEVTMTPRHSKPHKERQSKIAHGYMGFPKSSFV